MNAETVNQAFLFLVFLLNGILIGIISGIIVMYSLFIFNNGAFRGYIFIGILLGITTYMLFFSKVIIDTSVVIISFIKKIISFILKIILYPLRILYNCIKVIFVRSYYKGF